jgi:CRISPR/Cas system-associated protein Csx1
MGTVYGTLAPGRYSFLKIGCDAGFVSFSGWESYLSIYPFAHYVYYRPFSKDGNKSWYAGGGFGLMYQHYAYDELSIPRTFFAVDLTTGFILRDFLDLSYTLRTNLSSASNKFSVGFVHRFN